MIIILFYFIFQKKYGNDCSRDREKNKETRPHQIYIFFSSFMYYSCVNNWIDGLPLSHSVSYFYKQAESEGGKWTQFQMFQTLSLFQSFDPSVSASLCFYPAFDPMLSLLLMAGYRPVSIFNFHPPAGEYLVNKTNINDSNNDSGVNMQWCPYTIAQYNFFPHVFPLLQL